MLISQTIEPFYKIKDNETIIQMFEDAGFDAFDISFCIDQCDKNHDFIINHKDYLKRAYNLRKFVDKHKIVCNQAHAPFPSVFPGNDEMTKKRLNQIKRSIKVAYILGAKVIVVHPWNNYSPKENAEFYNQLIPTLKKYPIKVGVENMFNWDVKNDRTLKASCSSLEDYTETMKLLDPKYFVVNLDIGHAEIMEPYYSTVLIEGLNSRIKSLHVHDNDQRHDNHAIPYTKNIDFHEVVKKLKEINYKGDMTLEVIFNHDTPIEDYKNIIDQIYQTGLKLRKDFENDL